MEDLKFDLENLKIYRSEKARLYEVLSKSKYFDPSMEIVWLDVKHVSNCNRPDLMCCTTPFYRCLIYLPDENDPDQWWWYQGMLGNDPDVICEGGMYTIYNEDREIFLREDDRRMCLIHAFSFERVEAIYQLLQKLNHYGAEAFYDYQLTTAWAREQ